MAKAKQQTEQTEAEKLATAIGLSSKTVTVRGEEVTVEEFEIEQLPQLLTLIKELFEKAKDGAVTDALLLQSGELGIKLAMLAIGKPRAWFKKLPLGDGLALYSALIEANASFFAQTDQFVSLIELVSGVLAPVMATSGRSSSPASQAEVLQLVKSDASSSVSFTP